MSTIYMSQLSTALPLMEGSGDHHHHHHNHGHHQDHHHHHQGHFQAFSLPTKQDPPLGLFPFVISSSSAGSSGSYGSDHHAHTMLDHHHQPHHMIGGSSSVFAAAPPFPTVESIRDDMIERSSSSFDPYDIDNLQHAAAGGGSAANKAAAGNNYWSTVTGSAPAKMRITRKATDPGAAQPAAAAKKPRRRAQQAHNDYSYSGGGSMNQALGVIRVCSDCNTTKTPLWRSGPCGPKSLCNACGIRQRKARRAAMTMASGAAVAGGGGTGVDAAAVTAVHVHLPKVKKEKRSAVEVDRSLPFKKRCKVQVHHTAANTTTTVAAAPVKAAAAEPFVVTAATADAAAPARDLAEISMGAKWSRSPATTSSVATAACFRPSAAPAPAIAAVQDEITDAALLLMTLSCELVRS